jgi:hypothetical protein
MADFSVFPGGAMSLYVPLRKVTRDREAQRVFPVDEHFLRAEIGRHVDSPAPH